MKLTKKIIIRGEIEALTGLLIGGTDSGMGIGGPDKIVIRNPINGQPYIPGSSLKGKMRALTEIANGKFGDKAMSKDVVHTPNQDQTFISTRLYGNSPGNEKQRPSRVIVRDAHFTKSTLEKYKGVKTDLPFTEAKTEVVIDRITSAAMPRTFERVPAGVAFNFEIVLNIFDKDVVEEEEFKEDDLKNCLLQGMRLLQDDYLGGSGSRGCGQIKFNIKEVVERTPEYYLNGSDKEQLAIEDWKIN